LATKIDREHPHLPHFKPESHTFVQEIGPVLRSIPLQKTLSAAKNKFKDLTAMLARLLDVPINQVDNLAYIGVRPDLSTGSGSSTSGEDDLDEPCANGSHQRAES